MPANWKRFTVNELFKVGKRQFLVKEITDKTIIFQALADQDISNIYELGRIFKLKGIDFIVDRIGRHNLQLRPKKQKAPNFFEN